MSEKETDRQIAHGEQKVDARSDAVGGLPRFSSASLLGEAREALIEHNKDVYRLRITSNDKLILTK